MKVINSRMVPSSIFQTLVCGYYSILGGITGRVSRLTELVTSRRETINEMLFYGSEDDEKKKQLGMNNLFCIYYVIIQASFTIDVCVPSLVSDTISQCLINVQQKNKTKIRIVVHRDDGNFGPFLQSGIDVKVVNPRVKLEHEFILIDALVESDAIAIIGSLDYEVARVNCNREATLVTSEPAVVSALKREFDRVWESTD